MTSAAVAVSAAFVIVVSRIALVAAVAVVVTTLVGAPCHSQWIHFAQMPQLLYLQDGLLSLLRTLFLLFPDTRAGLQIISVHPLGGTLVSGSPLLGHHGFVVRLQDVPRISGRS